MSIDGIGARDPRQMMFARLDQSGDGKLDKTELGSFAEKLSSMTGQTITADQLLKLGDKNGDGTLSADELPPPPPPPGEWGGQSRFERHRPHPFAKLDTDGSGGLSASELSAMAERISQRSGQVVTGEQLLGQLDRDGDSQVSRAELDQGRASMQQQVQAQLGRTRTRIR